MTHSINCFHNQPTPGLKPSRLKKESPMFKTLNASMFLILALLTTMHAQADVTAQPVFTVELSTGDSAKAAFQQISPNSIPSMIVLTNDSNYDCNIHILPNHFVPGAYSVNLMLESKDGKKTYAVTTGTLDPQANFLRVEAEIDGDMSQSISCNILYK
jgi:hypothetical protein